MDSTGLACRLDYIPTVPGVLKLIELFCDVLAVILCGAASPVDGGSGHKGFFLFVSILALIITFVLFVLMMLNLQNMLLKGRWPLIEFLWCIFIALLYFIASIVIATIAKYNGVYGGAAFFGFAAMITYAADAFFQFREHRTNSFAQNDTQYGPGYNQRYAPSSEPYPSDQRQQHPPSSGPFPSEQRQQYPPSSGSYPGDKGQQYPYPSGLNPTDQRQQPTY